MVSEHKMSETEWNDLVDRHIAELNNNRGAVVTLLRSIFSVKTNISSVSITGLSPKILFAILLMQPEIQIPSGVTPIMPGELGGEVLLRLLFLNFVSRIATAPA